MLNSAAQPTDSSYFLLESAWYVFPHLYLRRNGSVLLEPSFPWSDLHKGLTKVYSTLLYSTVLLQVMNQMQISSRFVTDLYYLYITYH